MDLKELIAELELIALEHGDGLWVEWPDGGLVEKTEIEINYDDKTGDADGICITGYVNRMKG